MVNSIRLPPTPVLLLGTFHLEDKGRDYYKPQHRLDIAARQADILEVTERLAAFQPTKVAVEVDALQQDVLDRDYAAFVRGEFELSGKEHHQLGFRLAERLEHERIYAVNAWGRFYEPPRDIDVEDASGHPGASPDPHAALEVYAREHAQTHLIGPWMDIYTARFAADDEKKTRQSIRDTLREMNGPENILEAHGVYLVDYFKVGVGLRVPRRGLRYKLVQPQPAYLRQLAAHHRAAGRAPARYLRLRSHLDFAALPRGVARVRARRGQCLLVTFAGRVIARPNQGR